MILLDLVDWLIGCRHRKTTLPKTTVTSAHSETYLVCLDCGRHIPYDWTAMRRKRFGWNTTRAVADLSGSRRVGARGRGDRG